ncbi:MAG: HYR domain-containing protein [Thermoproteota archaeon]|nr:HYR domain-containing protein [Thermoproteota archaeon]
MKGLVFATLFASLLLVGTISSQSFGMVDHRFVSGWGNFGVIDDGEFLSPQQLASDNEGNIYVADSGNARIQKFTSDGQFLVSWGVKGSENGQFEYPVGITTYENFIYVVDKKLNNVQKFDSDGNFILKWGVVGKDPGQFSSPHGIEIDSNGIVYVADTKNYRIQQFTTDGEFLSAFGKFGPGDGALRSPIDVTVYENYVYVADPGNYKIEKYNNEGDFIKSFDYNFGGSPIRPGGLTTDPDGNIYFTDSLRHRVVQINSEGTTLTIFGNVGNGKGQFMEPKDIILDNQGYIFVIDPTLAKIQKFHTPIVMKIEQALADGQTKKLEELAYSEESGDSEIESIEEKVISEEPTVVDTTKPVLIAPTDLVVEATGSFMLVDIGKAAANDENGIQLLVNNAPHVFPLGYTTVIWTAIDNSGNTESATQVIHVLDTTSPVIVPIPDIVAEAVVPLDNIVELQAPSAADTFGDVVITSDAPEFFPIGETVVTWTATDLAGNVSNFVQKVTITDTIIPILRAPEDIVIEATSLNQNEINLGEATVSDNGEIVSMINDASQFFAIGDTIVTWSVADASGNVSNDTQLVSVVDTTAPEVLPLEDVIVEAISINENIVSLVNPYISDIQEVIIYKDAPELFTIGETSVTWIVTDASGNHSVSTQTVSIIDTTIPDFTVPEDLTIEATSLEATFVEIGQAQAEDITGISSIANNAPETFPLGSTVVSWSATDNYGNTVADDQTITVVDTTAPTIIAEQDIVVEAVDPIMNHIELNTPDAADNVGIESIVNDSSDTFSIGSTVVTWTVTDTYGNNSQATQVVTVVDTTAPEVSIPSDIVAEAVGISNNSVELGIATAVDIMGVVSISNNAPGFYPIGETTITWTAIDLAGNSATATQTVTIVDTTAPSISAPDSVTVEATSVSSNTVELSNPISNDLIDIPIISNNAPGFYPIGETTITWTAIDLAGNSATATQTVTIVDTTAPELTIPDQVVISAFSLEEQVQVGTGTAFDLTDSVPTIVNDAPETFPLGDTIVTWNAYDKFGNTAVSQQVISVQPCGQPVSYYNQILGTSEDNIIRGTDLADLIFAFGGDDIIYGGQGNDCIVAGEGNDLVFGNAGSDHLVGGEGNDILKGYSGEDKLTGGLGFDVLDGGDDFDLSYDSVSDIVINCEEEL